MEKLNSIIKAIIGLLLIISFVMTFSYCTKKQENQAQTDTTSTSHETGSAMNSPESNKGDRWSEVREKVNQEEKELDSKMRELETKASSANKKLKADVHKTTEEIKTERDKIKPDSLNPEFSNKWDEFITKSNNKLDSLKEKLR